MSYAGKTAAITGEALKSPPKVPHLIGLSVLLFLVSLKNFQNSKFFISATKILKIFSDTPHSPRGIMGYMANPKIKTAVSPDNRRGLSNIKQLISA